MIRMFIIFLLVWAGLAIAMTAVRHATGKQLLDVARTVGYSLVAAILAVTLLLSIVIVF